MPLILGSNSVSGYTVKNSLRFNSGSSDKLSRSATSGSNTKYTVSCWVKRSGFDSSTTVFSTGDTTADNNARMLFINADNRVQVAYYNAGYTYQVETSALLRDPSAWYHLVSAVDTTQATASDRIKIYINGTLQTSLSTANYPSQNSTFNFNSATQYIGDLGGRSIFSNFYLADFYYVDGTQVNATSFGETDEDTGIWKPKAYTGTYGTNGFYLQFKNSASLGTDSSGNGNTFTVNNLTSVDQSTDTPSNNFATLNPIVFQGTGVAFSEGNLKYTISSSSNRQVISTFGATKGKWYFENKVTQKGGYNTYRVGLSNFEIWATNNNMYQEALGQKASAYDIAYESTGSVYANNSTVGTSLGTYTNGDIIGVAYDLDNNFVYFSKNGTFINSGVPTSGSSGTGGFSITNGYNYTPAIQDSGFTTSAIFDLNYGNPDYSANSYQDANGFGDFSYSVPSGYYSLNTRNLAQYG
jgi:hypothetical protein